MLTHRNQFATSACAPMPDLPCDRPSDLPSKNIMVAVIADVICELLTKTGEARGLTLKEIRAIFGEDVGDKVEVTEDDIKIIRGKKAAAISPKKVERIYRLISQIKHRQYRPKTVPDVARRIKTELIVRRSTYGFKMNSEAAGSLASMRRFYGDFIGVGQACLSPGQFFLIRWRIEGALQGLRITQTALHHDTGDEVIYDGTGSVVGGRLDVKIENRKEIAGEPDEVITFLLRHDAQGRSAPAHLYGTYIANGVYSGTNAPEVPSAALTIFVPFNPDVEMDRFAELLSARWISAAALEATPLFSDKVKRFLLAPAQQPGMVQAVIRD